MNTLITALATPYKNGKIDTNSYEKLVNYQVTNGVNALLAVGTTAESLLLRKYEKKQLVSTAKLLANGTPVWVGVGGHSTFETIREAAFAEQLGADGILIAPPAFVKCTPQGYVLYVQEVLKNVSVPVMLYNAPSRCNYTLDKDAVSELAKRVRYLKDAGNDLNYTATLSEKLKVMCGNDALLPEMLKRGAKGVVSVVSNVAPLLTRRILDNDTHLSKYNDDVKLFRQLAELSMLEVNPIAIKYMLYKKGIFDSYNVRLPLTRANEETQSKINKILNENIQ